MSNNVKTMWLWNHELHLIPQPQPGNPERGWEIALAKHKARVAAVALAQALGVLRELDLAALMDVEDEIQRAVAREFRV